MDNVETFETSTLSCFQRKIKEAISLVQSMTTEDKLKAVQYWNVVSENLQDVVNSSADDISALASQLSERESLIAQEHLKLCNSHLPHYQRTAVHHAFALASRAVNFHAQAVSDNVASLRQADGVNSSMFDLSDKQDSVTVLGPDMLDHLFNVQQVETASGVEHPVSSLIEDQCASLGHSSELDHSLPDSVANGDLSGDTVVISGHQLVTEGREFIHNDAGPGGLGISDADYARQEIQEELRSQDPQVTVSQTPDSNMSVGLGINVSENDEYLQNTDTHHDFSTARCNSETPIQNIPTKQGRSSKLEGTVSAPVKCCTICKKKCPASGRPKPDQLNNEGFACAECKKSPVSNTTDTFYEPTGSGKQPIKCKECSKEFTTLSNLNRHMRSHTGYRPFECPDCKKRFPEKKSLMVHSRLHSGERPYQCSVCGARFVQLGALNTHLEMHANVRQHLCDTCGKPFRQKAQLKLHQLRHEGKKEFQCDKCPMAFNVVNDLKRHARSHLDDKPFKCDKCVKSFPRLQALTEHLNRHYGNKPYQCTVCSKSFADLSACKKHTKIHNKPKPPVPLDPPSSATSHIIGDHVLGLPAVLPPVSGV